MSDPARTVRSWSARICSVLAFMLLVPAPAMAQSYPVPSKPIKIIVPTTPGGLPDILARIVSQKLGELWKVPVVVENRAGVGGAIAATAVAKSQPDGYTLLLTDGAVWGINPHVYQSLGYNPLTDFAPVIQLGQAIGIIVVNPTMPAKNIQEFVSYAKRNPGAVVFASVGVGTGAHLVGEMFSKLAGIKMLHVPYKGAEAITAVLAGDANMTIFSVAAIEPYVKAGKLRVLATTAPRRAAAFPDIPTLAESITPDFSLSSNFGVLAAAGTPPAIVAKLNAGIATVLADPSFTPNFVRFGMLPEPDATPARLAAAIRTDYENYGKIIKELGVKVE